MQLSFAPLQRTDGFQASEAVMRVTRAATRHSSLSNGRSALKLLTGQSAYSHPKSLIEAKHYYFPVVIFFRKGAGLCFRPRSWQVYARAEPRSTTIVFISLSAPPGKIETDWDKGCADIILRRCPICGNDSIIGHGRRRKQAHDEHHSWIEIRRGYCSGCGTTFTFLPLFSLPYTHYSLLARCRALLRRFVERCCWEAATPMLQDPDRMPDPSTVRRWSNGMELMEPAASFLRLTLARIVPWLTLAGQADQEDLFRSQLTLVLQVLWPLRL
jgi:hypothetical protein